MRTRLQMSYTSTNDGGVTVKVANGDTGAELLTIDLDDQGVVDAAAHLLAYSRYTEAEYSNNSLQVR